MPKPYNSVRLVESGLIQGVQTWSIGFTLWASDLVGMSATAAQALAAIALEKGQAWWNTTGGPQQLASDDTDLRSVAVYYYPAGSKTATVQGLAIAAPHPAAQPHILPNQAAIVCSLRTGLPGRSNRGRIYLPANGATLVNHQLSSTQTSSTAIACAAHINDLSNLNSPDPSLQVVVGTELHPTPPIVTSVIVDSRVDTVRARADKESVLYTGNALV